MNSRDKERLRSRRDFFRQTACASLGVTGLVNALAQLRLMSAAMAQGSVGSDYKALVCLFLNGGNDANNLLVPLGTAASSEVRADYEAGRGVIGLPTAGLHPLTVPSGCRAFQKHYGIAPPAMGVHPSAAGIARLFNSGKLAFVSNVGTLAYPVPTRADYNARVIPLPQQLFSHSDQQTQWQSSVPDRAFTSGWGGRAADLLNASYNSSAASKVSMSISLAGVNSFQVGTSGDVIQYVVRSSGTQPLSGFGTNYSNALNADGSYRTTDTGRRFKAFEDIMRLSHDNLHEEEYNRVVVRARAAEGTIGAALTAADDGTVDIPSFFTNADSTLGDQLQMVARLIAGRSALGNNRQIFFCQVSGYDTHQTILSSHAGLVNELSNAMEAFQTTLEALGVANQVTTFTASDFNRTFTPNNTDAAKAGSDHAWGSHAMVMGGAVRGGDIYGHFPALKIGSATGSIDVGGGNRGRWIPDVSVDQYAAVLTSWMGAGSNELEAIFPNLPRFDDPFSTSSPNLGFI